MARVPLAALLSIQMLVAAIGIAIILPVFIVIHNKAVEKAATESVTTTLKFASERITVPLSRIRIAAKAVKEMKTLQNDWCNDGRKDIVSMNFSVQLFTSMTRFEPLAWAIYEAYRLPNPRPGLSPANDTNYDWTDCGCTNPVHPQSLFCAMGDSVTSANDRGVFVVMNNQVPVTNMSEFTRFPYDSTNEGYVQYAKQHGHEDGRWSWPTAWVTPLQTISEQLGFQFVLSRDSNGIAKHLLAYAVELRFVSEFLSELAIASTTVHIIDAQTGFWVGSAFKFPLHVLDNTSDIRTTRPRRWDEAPNSDLVSVISRMRAASPGGSFLNLGANDTLVDLKAEKYVIGASVSIIGIGRTFVVISMTDREFYFKAGRDAQVTAIIVGLAVLALLCITVILIIIPTVGPLQNTTNLILKISRLEDAESVESFSALAEVGSLQEASNSLAVAFNSFTRYVPRDVVVALMRTNRLCDVRMSKMNCSMLFADIVSFTSMCERVTLDVLSQMLSLFFDRVSRHVMHHGGIIDKFVGDCIMAVWGAPFPSKYHELQCTLAAMMMSRETQVNPLRDAFLDHNERLGVRIGAASGDVLAGNMGSSQRMNYTVIGDNVNLAARLEPANKIFGTHVLISDSIAKATHNAITLRKIFPLVVVGKADAVMTFQPLAIREPSAQLCQVSSPANKGGASPQASNQPFDSADSAENSEAQVLSAEEEESFAKNADRPVGELMKEDRALEENCLAATPALEEYCAAHNKAVDRYLGRDFKGAIEILEENDKHYEEGGAAQNFKRTSAKLLIDRCKELQIDPPGDEWRGELVAETK